MTHPVVLVHGAWHGAWCFDHIADSLRDLGLEALVPELGLKTVSEDVSTVRACLEAHPGAVVVGHSYGGIVISEAAVGVDVKHLVYMCAYLLDREEPFVPQPSSDLSARAIRPDKNNGTTVDAELAEDLLYHDCSPELARSSAQRLRPTYVDARRYELQDDPAWRAVPSTYIVCTQDRALSPDFQRELSRRVDLVVEWPVSHSPFLSQPDLVVELLAKQALRT